jgi:hypothetical protein
MAFEEHYGRSREGVCIAGVYGVWVGDRGTGMALLS